MKAFVRVRYTGPATRLGNYGKVQKGTEISISWRDWKYMVKHSDDGENPADFVKLEEADNREETRHPENEAPESNVKSPEGGDSISKTAAIDPSHQANYRPSGEKLPGHRHAPENTPEENVAQPIPSDPRPQKVVQQVSPEHPETDYRPKPEGEPEEKKEEIKEQAETSGVVLLDVSDKGEVGIENVQKEEGTIREQSIDDKRENVVITPSGRVPNSDKPKGTLGFREEGEELEEKQKQDDEGHKKEAKQTDPDTDNQGEDEEEDEYMEIESYEELDATQLREQAKLRGLKVASNANKKTIISVLEKADEEGDE